MKRIVYLWLFVLCCGVAVYGQEPVVINYDKQAYEQMAEQKFVENLDDPKFILFLPTYNSKLLDFWSIPIFEWRKDRHYQCGGNIEPLIDFSQDVRLQYVMVIPKDLKKRSSKFLIEDTYVDKKKLEDSINEVPFYLHPHVVRSDANIKVHELDQYYIEHPGIFVFMLRGMYGYWAVIDGKIQKLVYQRGMITGESANKYLAVKFGEEYVNDIIHDRFRLYYPYYTCPEVKVNDPIPVVVNFK